MEVLNQILVSDLCNYCRTCLKVCHGERYDVNLLPASLFRLFQQCIPYEKDSQDFPSLLCPLCYETLVSFEELQSTALRSTHLLEQVLKTKITAANIDEEPDNTSVQQKLLEKSLSPTSSFDATPPSGDEIAAENYNVRLRSQTEKVQNFEEIYLNTESQTEICEDELLSRFTIPLDDSEHRKRRKPKSQKKNCDEKDLRENNLYTCSHCDRNFRYAASLNRHLTHFHNIKGSFTNCPQKGCKKTFDHNEIALQHYQLNHKQKVEKRKPKDSSCVCEDCGRIFKNIHKLKDHRYQHEPVDARPFHCKECDKRFTTKRSFQEHQLRHDGMKAYKCPFCQMKKTTARELRVHINYHTKEKQYPCPLCPRIFNRSANLKTHDRVVHKGIRRFNCRYCDQSFGKPDTLKHHEMRHTGEKPHKCKICEKSFIQPSALKTHMKTHSNK